MSQRIVATKAADATRAFEATGDNAAEQKRKADDDIPTSFGFRARETAVPVSAEKPHLGIDAVGTRGGGGAEVLLDILPAVLERAELSGVTLFCLSREERTFDIPRLPGLTVVEKAREGRSGIARGLWPLWGLPKALVEHRCSGLLALNQAGVAPRGIPSVVLIQQALLVSPEAVRTCSLKMQFRIRVLRAVCARSVRRARAVVVQSAAMKTAVGETFRMPANMISIVPPSPPLLPSPESRSRALDEMRSAPSGTRVLYVGLDAPYKNLATIASALRALRKKGCNGTLFMTLPSAHPLTQADSAVVGLGALNRREVAEAYALADVLVMPSLVETVGFPMLEAMSMGVAVLAADRPYAREVCGSAAEYFNPLSVVDAETKLGNLLEGCGRRAELSSLGLARAERAERARSGAAMAELVASVIRDGRRAAWGREG